MIQVCHDREVVQRFLRFLNEMARIVSRATKRSTKRPICLRCGSSLVTFGSALAQLASCAMASDSGSLWFSEVAAANLVWTSATRANRVFRSPPSPYCRRLRPFSERNGHSDLRTTSGSPAEWSNTSTCPKRGAGSVGERPPRVLGGLFGRKRNIVSLSKCITLMFPIIISIRLKAPNGHH